MTRTSGSTSVARILLGGGLAVWATTLQPTAAFAAADALRPVGRPPGLHILEPTQGRPMILEPGQQFRLVLGLGEAVEGDAHLFLRHARATNLTVPLSAADQMRVFDGNRAAVSLHVPVDANTGMYDLVLRTDQATLTARRSISVVREFKTRFRFVHLSDMTIDDPTAPAFDERLVEEVNLVAPEFIIATGDYTAWGRDLDDAGTWDRVLDYFAGFDAPVYMLCGDRDHQESFVQRIAHAPAATFTYGRCQGILLLDHAAHPLDDDQAEFLRNALDARRDEGFTMIAAHNDNLSLLDRLAPPDLLPEYLRERKVALIITGGSDDWDRREYAERLAGLDVRYVRTHQASTALRGRATGVSRYRVFEVDDDRVTYVYSEDGRDPGFDQSIAVGRLRVLHEPAPVADRAVTILNGLNQRFDDARIWLILPRTASGSPAVAGGRLLQVLDTGDTWLCEVSVDLPERGAVRVLATADDRLPEPLPVRAEHKGDARLQFRQETSPAGLVYYTSDQQLAIELQNLTDRQVRTYPMLRLAGAVLPFTVEDQDGWPVLIPPGGRVILNPRLHLPQPSEGEHLLQVTFLEDPGASLTTIPVTLVFPSH